MSTSLTHDQERQARAAELLAVGAVFPQTGRTEFAGLSFREYAAVQALQGLLASTGGQDPRRAAGLALAAADSLIDALAANPR